VPEEAQLLELEWYTLEIIITYNECKGYRRKGSYAEDNRGQRVLQGFGVDTKGKGRREWRCYAISEFSVEYNI